jgi:hypothetical protein
MAANAASFFALSWWERKVLAQALMLLPLTALALPVVPVRKLSIGVNRSRTRRDHDYATADRVAHMVAAAAAYGPYRATCLPQSIVLQWLLRRNGIPSELRYGARRVDGNVTAHCWVELDGRPLIDSAAVRREFTVLEPSAACPPEL